MEPPDLTSVCAVLQEYMGKESLLGAYELVNKRKVRTTLKGVLCRAQLSVNIFGKTVILTLRDNLCYVNFHESKEILEKVLNILSRASSNIMECSITLQFDMPDHNLHLESSEILDSINMPYYSELQEQFDNVLYGYLYIRGREESHHSLELDEVLKVISPDRWCKESIQNAQSKSSGSL